MADTKLIDLPALTSASSDDLLYIVDDPGGTPVSKKITVANLATGFGAGASALVLLQTVSATASASIELTALSNTYTNYLITLTNYVAATDASNCLLTLSESASYYATNYRWVSQHNGTTTAWGNVKSASDSSIRLWGSTDNTVPIQMTIKLLGTNHAGGYATVMAELAGFNGSAEFFAIDTKGVHSVTTILDKVKIAQSAGNITTGVARLYGLVQ